MKKFNPFFSLGFPLVISIKLIIGYSLLAFLLFILFCLFFFGEKLKEKMKLIE